VIGLAAPEWIDCFGATIEVEGGRVRCPLERRLVDVERCAECRHLTASSDERRTDADCRVPDVIDGR
jgi:hypothetical protein